MVQWDQSGLKGAYGRYEVILLPRGQDWSYVIWIGKTILTRQDSIDTKETAQRRVEDLVDRLSKDSSNLEKHLYGDEEDDDEME